MIDNLMLWIPLGIVLFVLLNGLIAGFTRGWKRAAFHTVFFALSFLLAFLITKPITTSILAINIDIGGTTFSISDYINDFITSNALFSYFDSATAFTTAAPVAFLSPIVFIVLFLVSLLVTKILYHILARIFLGNKKEDFEKSKPQRGFGALIGVAESFLFLILMFSPLTALTQTYNQAVDYSASMQQTFIDPDTNTEKEGAYIATLATDYLPTDVTNIIEGYNSSALGVLTNMGGLGQMLFDNLSSVGYEGKTITLRKDILNISYAYDDFVLASNKIMIEQNYLTDISEFILSVENILSSNLFEIVVADSIVDFVTNYNEIFVELGVQTADIPKFAIDSLDALKINFSAEDFDSQEYFKNDILKLLDIVHEILEKGYINDYEVLTSSDLGEILEYVSTKSDSIAEVAKNILSLNLVEDLFEVIIVNTEELIKESLGASSEIILDFNEMITDKNKLIDDLIGIVDDVIEINNLVDIEALANSSNIPEYLLTSVTEIDKTLTTIGDVLDGVRNLEFFVTTNPDTNEKTYFVDGLLEGIGFTVLGDEVYTDNTYTTKTTLDTYTKFVDFIKTPLNSIVALNIQDILSSTFDFDAALSTIVGEIEKSPTFLSDLLMPLYQLESLDIKTLAFDNVIGMLETNISSLVSFDKIKAEVAADIAGGGDGVAIWAREIDLIGEILISLNKGEIGLEKQTYLNALMSATSFELILEEMAKNNHIKDALTPIFESLAFEGIVTDIFANIDQVMKDITGVSPTTITTGEVFENNKLAAVDTIAQLFALLETIDVSTINIDNITSIGQILDILKTNAYNSGTKDGVFADIFANFVWYMTGDDITGTGKYTTYIPNENALDIKTHLGIDATANFEGYFTVASFENVFADISEMVKFADKLAADVFAMEFNAANAESILNGFDAALLEVTIDEQEQLDLLNNLSNIIAANGEDLLTTTEIATAGADFAAQVDLKYATNPNLANAIKDLLGLI